jgi:hypothetical protein
MPRISRKGSGPGLQALKRNCNANPKRVMISAVLFDNRPIGVIEVKVARQLIFERPQRAYRSAQQYKWLAGPCEPLRSR